MDYYSFENLKAYRESRILVIKVYDLIKKLPIEERFDLGSQLRRSIISVPSNIAEGSGRVSYKEKIHFLEISFGSLMESYCQLELFLDLGYITIDDFISVRPQFFTVSRLINALKQSFEDKITL